MYNMHRRKNVLKTQFMLWLVKCICITYHYTRTRCAISELVSLIKTLQNFHQYRRKTKTRKGYERAHSYGDTHVFLRHVEQTCSLSPWLRLIAHKISVYQSKYTGALLILHTAAILSWQLFVHNWLVAIERVIHSGAPTGYLLKVHCPVTYENRYVTMCFNNGFSLENIDFLNTFLIGRSKLTIQQTDL